MEYKKILVAVDQFEHSLAVYEEALDLARKEDAKLMVFHCIKQDTPAELMGRIGTFAEMDQSESLRIRRQRADEEIVHARAWVEELCKQAIDKGISVESDVEEGNSGPLICDLAAKWGADLIILGRTRRGRLSERFLGSVSNYVIHHTPCSLLLVR